MKLMCVERNGDLHPVLCREMVLVNRAGEMESGIGQRNGMNRATLAVRYNPAYELNELTRATGPGEARTGKRER